MSRARGLRLLRPARRGGICPRGAERGPICDSSPRSLLLRRVGVGRLPLVAAEGSRHRRAQHRSQIHGARAALAAAPRQGTRAAADRQWRPHHCGAGRKRVRLLRQRPRPTWSRFTSDLVDAGFNKSLLYTADGPDQIPRRLAARVARSHQLRARQREAAPSQPCTSCAPMVHSWPASGGMAGSISGAVRTTPPTPRRRPMSLDWILEQGYSISIYMFHGGTSFGWMNGANMDNTPYEPDVTSYDYDAALDESGRPTPKYFLFRDAIAKATGITPPPVPAVDPPIATARSRLQGIRVAVANAAAAGPLRAVAHDGRSQPGLRLHSLPHDDRGPRFGRSGSRRAPRLRADLRQRQTAWARSTGGWNKIICTSISTEPNTRLDILVENTGRVNFTLAIRGERKGITKQVTLAGKPLTGWQIYPLPMSDPGKLPFRSGRLHRRLLLSRLAAGRSPRRHLSRHQQFHQGIGVGERPCARARLEHRPAEDALSAGPVAAPGANEVIVFDLEGRPGESVAGRNTPDLGAPMGGP